MRRFIIILGIITAVIALVLSTTPLSKLAFIPAGIAILLGAIAYYLARKQNAQKKSVQLLFLMVIIAVGLTSYKAVFSKAEVGNIEELEKKEEASVEDSKEILEELDLEELDLEGLEDE